MLVPTRILVPTDFSEFSDRALGQALDIAKQYGAKVHVLHVLVDELYHFEDLGNITDVWQRMEDNRLAIARQNLQNQLDRFPESKEVEVVIGVRRGLPHEEILKEGKEQGIDLIVIASLGRTGIAKYFIGSVARNVLKGSKCPVLLTK
jgi:nucleotide-binding universal stress UspA family protein